MVAWLSFLVARVQFMVPLLPGEGLWLPEITSCEFHGCLVKFPGFNSWFHGCLVKVSGCLNSLPGSFDLVPWLPH